MKNKLTLFVLASIISMAGICQPTTFYPRGIGGGGSLFFPSINPANDNEFYVGCDMSDLFHSTDFGNTYSLIPFTKLTGSSTDATFAFTNNPNIAYSNFNDGNAGYPVKTTDGGVTWTQIAGYNVGTYGQIYAMRANYTNPSQLIIGAYGDILISSDGGNTFTLVKHAADMGAGITMGGVFWDGTNIYIGTNEGIYYSTNSGNSFLLMATTGMTSGQVIWSFAGGKTGSNTRFACIAANTGDVYNGVAGYDYYNFAKGVYIMDNASGTWVSKSTGINFSNDYVMYATMAWDDIDTIYLGGNDYALGAPLVYRSPDGGTTWAKKFNTTNNANIITAWEGYQGDKTWGWSECCFGISVAPYNTNKVMFSTYSCVYLSSDGGNDWKQANVNNADQHPASAPTPTKQLYHSIGLENTSCWQVFWESPAKMMGCFTDIGGIRSIDSGSSWGFKYTGFSVNTLYHVAKGNNGTMYGACSKVHDIYESTRLADAQLDVADATGNLYFSADSGATWATLHAFGHPVVWCAIDPNNQSRMYASVVHFGGTQGSQLGGIYKTDNLNNLGTSTWAKLANPPRTEGHPDCIVVLNDGKMVCTFSGRKNSSGAFTASSGVFLYDPTGSSWTDVSNAGMYYWTKDIVIDPNDVTQNTWYVCVYSGWGGAPNGLGGLYRTTNRGGAWIKLTGTQFDRCSSITFNPQNLQQAYLTTETQGLWVTNNISATTPVWTLVSSYPFRQPMRVFFNPFDSNQMWVSSFGNGMKLGYMNPITGIADFGKEAGKVMTVYPNPNHGVFNVYLTNSTKCDAMLDIYNDAGKSIFSKKISLISGDNILPISLINEPEGVYLINIQTSGTNYSGKILIE